MPAGVNVDGAAMTQLGRPASLRAADRRLAHFADDAALSAYLAAGMLNLPSNDTGSFSSPPPAVVFSQTNLQEQGVDEADSVKSDGTQVYTFAHGENGVRRAALRIAAVGNDGASLQVLGTVPLANGSDSDVATAGLFLHDGSLVALTGTQAASPVGWPWLNASAWLRGVTNVEILDASTRGTLASRWHAQLDGHLVASRRIGSRLYVVTRYAPYLSTFLYGASTPDSVEANRRLLARTPLAALLPKARIGGGEARPALPSTAVLVPPPGARRPMADMIVVTAIDIAARAIVQALAIVGNVETVYASPGNLFVASSRYVLRDGFGLPVAAEPPFIATDIHQIRLGADAMQGVGSASVEGSFGYQGDKGAFRMGEHGGRLRVVTSSQGLWGGENRNRLTILEPSTTSPGLLRTVSFLPNAQRPQPLGKPNEVLYGTRFAGDRLYAVTFRRIDPLYVVDLSDPADPRIASALEIPGFSEYLHPLPNGLLLGFGQSAEVAGTIGDGQWAWFAGLQLNLFDVRDADRPRELQRVVLGKRGSDSALLRHHHALSMLEQPDGARVLAFPARIHDGVAPPWADPSYAYPWLQSGLARFELRGTTAADARLVQLPMLVTHGGSLGNPPGDGSADDARSVLFRNGTIYVSGGRFWRQDPGGTTFGPF
jgi:hypothetical protein